jgi:hypothetical protein
VGKTAKEIFYEERKNFGSSFGWLADGEWNGICGMQ